MRALAGESVHTCIIFLYLYLEDESFFLLSLGIISLNAFYFFAKQYSIHDSVRYLLLNYSLAGIYVGCVVYSDVVVDVRSYSMNPSVQTYNVDGRCQQITMKS